jgi:hypothetical protein
MGKKAKTKFPTKAQLNALNIHNGHNLADLTKDKLFISFTPASTGRGGRSAHFRVSHIGYQSDPTAHFLDYGCKTFTVWGGKAGREKVLVDVIAWTNAKYGEREWVKDPFGSYQDAQVIALAWEKVEAAK